MNIRTWLKFACGRLCVPVKPVPPCLMAWRRGSTAACPGVLNFWANFQMTDAQWENLLIPINMAFFFQSSVEGKVVALYPSPAGGVESLLPLDAWNEIVQQNATLPATCNPISRRCSSTA